MTEANYKVKPDPRAADLMTYLTGTNDFEFHDVQMYTWVAKAHFGVDADGRDFRLALAGHGAYELAWKAWDGNYSDRPQEGHIEQTPAGKAARDAAAELGRKLTGHNLKVDGWTDFSGLASGRVLKPTGDDDDHSFILLELNDKQFAIVLGDNPNPDLTDVPAEYEEQPFAQGRSSRYDIPRVAMSCSINILDKAAFCEAMDVKTLSEVDGSTLASKMTVLSVDAKTAGLSGIECSAPTVKNGFLAFETRAHVEDFGALVREARGCYANCWADDDWYPASPEDALYEIALASNANPSPDVMGFEIVGMTPIEPDEVPMTETAEEPSL